MTNEVEDPTCKSEASLKDVTKTERSEQMHSDRLTQTFTLVLSACFSFYAAKQVIRSDQYYQGGQYYARTWFILGFLNHKSF